MTKQEMQKYIDENGLCVYALESPEEAAAKGYKPHIYIDGCGKGTEMEFCLGSDLDEVIDWLGEPTEDVIRALEF